MAPAWQVAVDPAPVLLKVPADPAFSVSSPTGDGVAYLDTPSPYVALGANEKPTDVRQVFDLRTGEPTGAIRGKYDFSDDARISPDGQYLLTESKGGPVVPSRSIEVWSFRTGQLVRKIEASPTPATVHLHGFAVGNQAVT